MTRGPRLESHENADINNDHLVATADLFELLSRMNLDP